jgi:hypothetical protein
MAEKIIFGSDLDGVIFIPPLPFYGLFKRVNFDYFLYRLRRKQTLRNAFYSLIRVDGRVVEILRQVVAQEHEVVIISGHSSECMKEVSVCLKRYNVPFNKLCLCPDGQSYPKFKLDKITELGCNIYLEDRADIVWFLRQHLDGICQIIHYKNHRSLFQLQDFLNPVV